MKKVVYIFLAVVIAGIFICKLFFESTETVNGTEDTSGFHHVHILAGIDSLTNGRLYGTNKSRYLDDFIPALKKKYGDGGPGYIPFDTKFFHREGGVLTFSKGLKEINNISHHSFPAPYSFDFKGLFTNAGQSGKISFQLKDDWKNGEILYLKQPGGGTFYVNYPKGDLLKVDTKGKIGLGVVILPRHEKNQPVIVSRIEGKVALFGGYFYNPSGVVVSRVGQGGDRLEWYAHLNHQLLNQWLQVLQPDLFIFNGGMNDRHFLSASQYGQALDGYLTPFRKAGCPLILTIPNAIYENQGRLNEYASVLRQYSKKHHTGLVSNKKVLGKTFEEAKNKGYMGDAIHPNAKGAAMISRHLLQYLKSHSQYQIIFRK
jgi:lysophospholipase L1-like esterase